MRSFLPLMVVAIGGAVCSALGGNVVVDGTVGKVAPLTGANLDITEDFGYRPNIPGSNTPGPNLFHSFKYFSLSSGDTAVFSGSAGINNILARVTGPDASTINGKIKSTIPGANFFLINPNGIIFGSGASIDIGGSFVATTANSVHLADGGHFDAIDAGKAPLTVAAPSAFGFLTPTPAGITVSSANLSVSDGHSISFIGGDVKVESSNIDAPNGAVHMISARGNGNVQMDFRTQNPTPALGTGLSGGDVNVSTSTIGGAGTTRKVVIRGGKLTTVDSFILATAVESGDGISAQVSDDFTATGFNFIATTARGTLPGENIVDVAAKNATISDGTVVAAFTENGTGRGDVHLSISGKLTINSFAGISNGSGGDVKIEAGSMLLSEGGYVVTSFDQASPSGDIRINVAGRLDIISGGMISTDQSPSRSSNIFVTARDIFISGSTDGKFSGFQSTLINGGDGPGPLIKLDVSGKLELSDGARIQATTSGGNGAQVLITAGEMVMANKGLDQNTGIFVTNESAPDKTAGVVSIDVQGSFSMLGGAAISADTIGLVPGGSVNIAAQRILIEGRGIEHGSLSIQGINSRNRTQGESGGSGDIILSFTDGLVLRNGAEILTSSSGTGRGGNIVLTGGDVSVAENSLIASETSAADDGGPGGNISMALGGVLSVTGGGQVSVATFGSGSGGSIDLHLQELSVSGTGSGILASTSGAGRGGDISIQADAATITEGGRVSAATTGSENAGVGGNVQLFGGSLLINEGGIVSVESFGPGAGGSIQIEAGQFAVSGVGSAVLATANGLGAGGSISIAGNDATLTDGGQIAAESLAVSGGGAGGSIRMEFDGTVEISGGALVSAATFGSGLGGGIEVHADQIVITGQGSAITAQSLGNPLGGDGGNIFLKVGELSLQDHGGILVSSASSGRAGTITIDASRRVVLTGGSSITAAAPESSGGEIKINGGDRIDLEDSRITAEAKTKGGNISLESRDFLSVIQSQITAAASTDGGNIFIDPQFVFLDGSTISANAIVGRGGNIQIFSDFFIASPDSLVTASSEKGINGVVQINAVNVDLTGNLVDLPSSFIRAESLLRELCTVKLQDFSSFIVEGRGGMAPVPGEWLSSLEPELPRKETPVER